MGKDLGALTAATVLSKTDLALIRQTLTDKNMTMDVLAEFIIRLSDQGFKFQTINTTTAIVEIEAQQVLYEGDTTASALTLTLPFSGPRDGSVVIVTNQIGSNNLILTYASGVSLTMAAGGWAMLVYQSGWKLMSNNIDYVVESKSLLSFYNIFSRIRKNGSSDQIIVPVFRVNLNAKEYFISSELTLSVSDLDTGSSFVFGSDYYIWAGVPSLGTAPVVKISLSATTPAGLTNPKIIGGFHYGKIRTSFTIADVGNGILSNSCWDLNHMPSCYLLGLSDPSTYQLGGMVEVIPGKTWVDIYLASEGGGTVPNKRVYSKINVVPLTGTENLVWYDFVARGRAVGKRMLFYHEWLSAALGSPQGLDASNLNGWTKTTNTARIKTAATLAADSDVNYILGYNTSLLNVRDCVGNVWEWLADLSNRHDTTAWAWQNVLDAGELAASSDFGQAHLPNATGMVAYIAGGHWPAGVFAGARAVHVNSYPWYVGTLFGCRFACDSL